MVLIAKSLHFNVIRKPLKTEPFNKSHTKKKLFSNDEDPTTLLVKNFSLIIDRRNRFETVSQEPFCAHYLAIAEAEVVGEAEGNDGFRLKRRFCAYRPVISNTNETSESRPLFHHYHCQY